MAEGRLSDQLRNAKATLSGSPQQKSDGPNEMHFFRHLRYVELLAVFIAAIFATGLSVHMAIWVLFGREVFIHARLVTALRQIDRGWKIALMIAVPLFFRPIFKFLINLRKGPFNTESGLPPSTGGDQEYQGR